MIVVVDSNQFHGDPRMAKRNFRILIGQHERGRLKIVIPEVVVREVPKMAAKQFESAKGQVEGAARTLRELGYDPELTALPEPAAVRADHERWLRQHLADRDIEIADIPDVDMSELVQQSVDERRPFRGDSKGFRDAVIWRTVRELAAEDDVIFVTKNWKDFAESADRADILHADLREDLEADGNDPDRVKLLPSLEEFIEKHVPPAEVQLTVARTLYAENEGWRDMLLGEAQTALYQMEFGVHDDVTVAHTEIEPLGGIEIDDAGVEEIEIAEAYETDDESLVSLELRVKAVITFGFTASVGDAEWLAEPGTGVSIDYWDSSYAKVYSDPRYVEVTFAADFNTETNQVGELEKIAAVDRAFQEPA